MEIDKINSNKYKFVFIDETHTIVHILQQELLKNEHVQSAGYSQSHPLETKMILTLETKIKNPKEVLNMAIDKLVEKIDSIEKITQMF